MKKKLGLVVNPIAGMGGRVGLKGTDGQEILDKAKELGARPESPGRAVAALRMLTEVKDDLELITYPCEMGEDEARECGLDPVVIGVTERGKTTSLDTRAAAAEMLKAKVDLLLFAGGDGTARDICSIIGEEIPALGIPAGVKIHSSVFGSNPQNAGRLAARYLAGPASRLRLRPAEVLDIDEQAFRQNRLSVRLFGHLRVPYERSLVQDAKGASATGEDEAIGAIADDVIADMEAECVYIIGPGTTTKAIMSRLGLRSTLLGVDAIRNRELVGLDLNESALLRILKQERAKIVVGVIGRQGYVFGRGNQQISPEVIRAIGKENIIVVATRNKLLSLSSHTLLADTGDDQLNKTLAGYTQVVTGLRERLVLEMVS